VKGFLIFKAALTPLAASFEPTARKRIPLRPGGQSYDGTRSAALQGGVFRAEGSLSGLQVELVKRPRGLIFIWIER